MQQITAGQIEQFIAVVRTGNVSRVEFQVGLDEPASLVKFFKSRPRASWYQDAVDFWEECFPGKGEALVELLAPFYRIKMEWEENGTPFPLKRGLRATASLKRRYQEAIFWLPWQGLVIIQDQDSLWKSLGDSLRDSLWKSFEHILQGPPWKRQDGLWYSLQDSLESLIRSLQRSLIIIPQDILRNSLGGSLWSSLFCACNFLITGDEEKTEVFRKLLGLWAEGIILAGFDKKGRLIIYSSPAESSE